MSHHQRIPLFYKQFPRKLKKYPVIPKWNIVRGDFVELLAGKDAGKQGTVTAVRRERNQVFVEGLNLHTRRIKAKQGVPGEIKVLPGPIHYSNVALVDPSTGKKTRATRRFLEDGTKVRVSVHTGTIIPKPEILKERRQPRSKELGPRDTPTDLAWKKTVEDFDDLHL